MKPESQVKKRLQAEEAACETDTTLFKNDYVQGYMDALRFVLEDDRN